MNIQELTPELSVSPQIAASDLEAIAAVGFRSVICNRPDGEKQEQPAFSDIDLAARAYGLQVRHLPVDPKNITDEDVGAFATLTAELPKPILAYCGTGTRATSLWALSQANKMPLAEIVYRAFKAGHDLKTTIRRIANQL
jgi:sulfide:quinone oxidoreductase